MSTNINLNHLTAGKLHYTENEAGNKVANLRASAGSYQKLKRLHCGSAVTCESRTEKKWSERHCVAHMRTHKSTVIIEVTQVRGVRVQCGTGLKRVDVTQRGERKSRKCKREEEGWGARLSEGRLEKREEEGAKKESAVRRKEDDGKEKRPLTE